MTAQGIVRARGQGRALDIVRARGQGMGKDGRQVVRLNDTGKWPSEGHGTAKALLLSDKLRIS